MWHSLKLRLSLGNLAIPDPSSSRPPMGYRGVPILLSDASHEARSKAVAVCPTGALLADATGLDLGKCLFCGRCAIAEPTVVMFTDSPKLGATKRENLIIKPGETEDQYAARAIEPREDLRQLFRRSLKLRQVSAGGCNACELELNASGNLNFDLNRYGIEFVASPRHADGIVLTGPISAAMAKPLSDTFGAIPQPKILVLNGVCAISEGPFADSKALNRRFLSENHVDLFLPGCPPHPLTIIQGLLGILGR